MVQSQELQRQGVTLREAPCARLFSSQDTNCRSPRLHAQHLRWGISSYTSYSCAEAVTVIPTTLRSSSICYCPKSFPKFLKKGSRSYGLTWGWQGLAFRQPAQSRNLKKSSFLLPPAFFFFFLRDR